MAKGDRPHEIESGVVPRTTLEILASYSTNVFLGYRRRRENTMVDIKSVGGVVRRVCGDPEVELSYRASERHINGLLEKYFTELNKEKFAEVTEGVVPPPDIVSIPIKHTNEVYPVEVDYDGA